jgi:hypothetical protein
MHPRIIAVQVSPPYRVRLTFADGGTGTVDLASLILREDPGVFAALRDPEFFAQVRVEPAAGTIAWPNQVDLDPDVLYESAMGGSRIPM